jgi:hypothetical protein
VKDLVLRSSEPTRSFGRWNSPQDDRAKAKTDSPPAGKDIGLESFLSAIQTVEFSEKKA